MKVGIIGCGLIGVKRANSLQSDDQLSLVCDTNLELAEKLAKTYDCQVSSDWHQVVSHPDIEVVIIATTHDALASITQAALEQGKHVLVEKPAARNADELAPVVSYYDQMNAATRPIVKVGFNHRFHPAMQQARAEIDAGTIGEMMFVRGRYGHGGRVGYDKEWRARPEISGGGELLDQGMHLIDLSRWYLGDFSKVQGTAKTYFWDMPVDDNAFMTLETAHGQVAQLHVTWTEWKNLFSLEIYGTVGKLHIDGLGKSYGTERLAVYKMKPEMGPPETIIHEYPGDDLSWHAEWSHFKESISQHQQPIGNLYDAFEGLKVVKAIYQQTQELS